MYVSLSPSRSPGESARSPREKRVGWLLAHRSARAGGAQGGARPNCSSCLGVALPLLLQPLERTELQFHRHDYSYHARRPPPDEEPRWTNEIARTKESPLPASSVLIRSSTFSGRAFLIQQWRIIAPRSGVVFRKKCNVLMSVKTSSRFSSRQLIYWEKIENARRRYRPITGKRFSVL